MQQEWTWRTNLKVLSLFIDVNAIPACMDFLFFLGLLNIIQASWISLLNLMQGRSNILGETHWNYHAPYHLTIPSNGNSEILTLMKSSSGRAESKKRSMSKRRNAYEQDKQHRKEDNDRFMVLNQMLSLQPYGMVTQPEQGSPILSTTVTDSSLDHISQPLASVLAISTGIYASASSSVN